MTGGTFRGPRTERPDSREPRGTDATGPALTVPERDADVRSAGGAVRVLRRRRAAWNAASFAYCGQRDRGCVAGVASDWWRGDGLRGLWLCPHARIAQRGMPRVLGTVQTPATESGVPGRARRRWRALRSALP